MGRIGMESDEKPKTQLVLQICSLSTSAISCAHRPHSTALTSHFIDWYRILGVAEEAEVEVIRKQYHKLALQLHPDKNKHPKAEVAFKLISEAHTCLSDSARRRAFNLERSKHFCIKCNKIPHTTCSSSDSAKLERHPSSSKSFRAARGLEDIKNRFREEARVIENCLRTNNLQRKEPELPDSSDDNNSFFRSRSKEASQKESPIFNPSDYLFHGYPHFRTQVYMKPAGMFCNLQRGLSAQNNEQGRGRFQQSPVFQNASGRGMFKSKSVCIRL